MILYSLVFIQDEREDGEVRIVTDNLNEMCEFECLLCGFTLVESTLSKHLKELSILLFSANRLSSTISWNRKMDQLYMTS